MSKAKMQWARPQLIVLARGRPEESVLTHCKGIHIQPGMGGPADSAQEICDMGPDKNCGNCQSRSGS